MLALHDEMDAIYELIQPQMGYVRAIREALPDDGIYVEEITQIGYVTRAAMPVYQPRTYLAANYQGTLGWGFPTALGAKVAAPDRPVLSVTGDGGFLFAATEMATAVKHRINTVTVVFNDSAFGNVRRMQKERYGGRVIASELHNPDFVAFAESFGARGLRVHSPGELQDALADAFGADTPVLIEVPVGEMPAPLDEYVRPHSAEKGRMIRVGKHISCPVYYQLAARLSTNSWCSGDAMPSSTNGINSATLPSQNQSDLNQKPGNTWLRSTPESSGSTRGR